MGTWRRLEGIIRLQILLMLLMSLSADAYSTPRPTSSDIPEARLLKALTSGAMANYRPSKNYHEQTNVTFSFVLSHVKSLNIAKQEFQVIGSFAVMWKDPFLSWNPAQYGNIYLTHISTASIWTPPFGIINSLSLGNEEEGWRKGKVDVYYDGSVSWLPKGVFTTLCNVNVYHFPFDTQTCTLDILQFHSTEAESIYIGTEDRSQIKLRENGEWTVMKNEVINLKTPSNGQNFSNVVFSYTLKRQPTFHVLTTIVPVLLLFAVGLMVFPLPADSGEKVSLCVACLMSFFIMQLMISQQIPRNWQSVPIIITFNSVFMMLNALSICVTVLVLNLHHRQPVNDVPKCLERFFGSRWGNQQKKGNKVHDMKIKEDVTPDAEDESRSDITMKDNAVLSMLSSMLEEMKKVRAEVNNHVDEEKIIRLKWRDVAEAVNYVLCAVYIFAGVLMSIIYLALWF